MISVPFGPGSAVLISGRFGGAMVVVDMIRSLSKWGLHRQSGLLKNNWLDKQAVETRDQASGES